VHAHGRVGRSRVNVHHDSLTTARGRRVTRGHVDRHVFMRAQQHGRMRPALLIPARQLFNDRHVISTEIGEDVVNPELR